MACPDPFNVLRLRQEDLGPTLYKRASWLDPWLNLIGREEYPMGAGTNRSAFTVGRSFPTTDEEAWPAITTSTGEGAFITSCGDTFNQVYVGYKEVVYKPEKFALVGPTICYDDLVLHWQSRSFWEAYFQAMEKRNQYSITNRLQNIYMQYVPKAAANEDFHFIDGDFATQPAPTSVDLSDLDESVCGLAQSYLDATALLVMQAGATTANSNGWITFNDAGPVFPLLIGVEASNRVLLNNSELRSDYRYAYEGFGEANPVIARMGASRIIKNFRHMITLTPPRWSYSNGTYTRVPTYVMSTDPTKASKGRVGDYNPDYLDPTVATHEGAIVLNPWVYTEEPLRPVGAMPNQKWQAQDYYGEWKFVTGNDAVLGFDDCAGIKDPLHTIGRHFARYKHAAKPIFPDYGRLIVFKRCPSAYECVSCST